MFYPQWHISLSLFLVAELIFGALVFIFYFFPGIRRDLNLAPEDWGLKEAIRKYKDDKGMRDWIDMVQREVCEVVEFYLDVIFMYIRNIF